MTVEKLEIHPGFLGYLPEYQSIMIREFPNYRGPRWAHAEHVTGARWMKTYICEECTKAYKEYHEGQKQKAQQTAFDKIDIVVEIVRFQEHFMRIMNQHGVCSWTSEIEFRIISPVEFEGIRVVERWGGYESDSPYVTVGNVLKVEILRDFLKKENIDANGMILGYTLPYPGFENLGIVSEVNSKPDGESVPNIR